MVFTPCGCLIPMDHFKRRLIPSSPFSRDLKSILINHLFGNKETEVKSIKQFIRGFIEKMKEVQEIAEKARAIGWIVGLSPQTTTNPTENYPKNPTGKYPKRVQNEEERQKFKRCWYCGSDPGRQSHPQSRHTSNSGRQCIF